MKKLCKTATKINTHFKLINKIFEENPIIINLLRTRSYIAGGSIRSLLSETQINDIDIFLYDDSTLEEFRMLISQHLQEGRSFGDWELYNTVNSYSFKHKEDLYPVIQIITFKTSAPEKMIEEFDFSINMNYYIPALNYLFVKDAESIANKLLVVNISNCNVINTFFRMHKFMSKGWRINSETLLDMTILLTSHQTLKKRDEVRNELLLGPSTINFDY